MKFNARIAVSAPALVLTCLLVSSGAGAHHSFSAEFSRDLPVEVTGVVTKVEWMNPHARFYIEADEDGDKVSWDFELTTPNILMRRGWRPDSLEPGDRVMVTGWRARNHPHVANANTVRTVDGKELFTGSAGNTAD